MKRPDKLFGHRLWMTPVASYIGFVAMMVAPFMGASLLWVLPMLACTYLILMGVTVGMHRLFCHSAFETHRGWHVFLGVLGTLAIYGSTVQWPAMHASHHKFSDTPKDPHYTGWKYLFWKKNRPTTFNRRVISRLYKDPLHRVLHQFYILVPIAVSLALLLISVEALVFCYLIPLGWLHLVGSFHQVFAHDNTGPKKQPWLELIMFTGGEWNHAHHHAKPRDICFGKMDAGYHFIRAIQKAPGLS